MKTIEERILLPCFVKDGAHYIHGETGRIMADSFKIDLKTRTVFFGEEVNVEQCGIWGRCEEDNDGIIEKKYMMDL